MPGLIGLPALSSDVTATMPLNTPAVSTATTGTLPVGATHRLDATSAALARTLPSAASAGPGGIVVVKKTDATSNAVTVTANGSDTINVSGSTRTLTLPREAAHFRSDGVSDWTVVASDTPVTQLDSRYDARYVTPATATGTYAKRIGQTVVLVGDSHTAFAGGTSIATPVQSLTTSYDSRGFFNWANVALRHGFRVIGNAGIAGQTSAQILARFATDVIAYNPDWVVILAGTNSDGSAAATIANLTSMYSQAAAAGIKVVAVTIPPNSSANLGLRQDFLTINRFIRDYCRANRGIVLADIGAALVDQTTTWQAVSGYLQTDNVHLSPQGAALAGRVLADAVRPFLPVSNDMLGSTSGDPTNLLTNPMMTGTGSTAPTSWTNVGANTISYVPRTDAVAGIWVQQAVTSTNTGGLTSNVSIGASLAIGDYVYAAVEFDCDSLETSAPANKQGLVLTLQFYNGSTFFSTISDLYWDTSYTNARYPLTSGVLQTPAIQVPATTTIAQVYLQARGAGNFRWHRAALRKVSGLGAI